MKSEWAKVPIESICQGIYDGPHATPAPSDSGAIFLGISNFLNGRLNFSDIRYIDEKDLPKWTKRVTPQAHDIVFSYEATLNLYAIIPEGFRGCLGRRLALMRPDESKVDYRYLYYYMYSPAWRAEIEAHKVMGSTVDRIPLIYFPSFTIELPNMTIQRRIADILSALDDKIELNQKINENLERQAQTLFRKWFVDNPDAVEWQSGTFSDLIEMTISGDWGKDAPSGKNTEMVYCIRGADIPDVRIGNKGKMPTRYILPKNYTAKQLVNGDIVVEISGGSPTQSTGRAAAVSSALLARYDKGMVCTNFCKALKPMAGYSMYVYHYWQHLYDMGVFFSYENGTTGIKNLDITGFLETEPITIAPFELIERFNSVCQSVYAKIYSNGLENERLADLRDTLLPKLMSGEVDVSAVRV